MKKQEAQRELDRFNASPMAKNKHRGWIGRMLTRIASGEVPPSESVEMLCRALEIKKVKA